MAKEKKRMSSLAAITIRISSSLLAFWLFCMVLITIITAQFVYTELRQKTESYVFAKDTASRGIMQLRIPYDNVPTGAMEYDMVRCVQGSVYYNGAQTADSPRLLRGINAGKYIKEAAAFYDVNGELILASDDYLYFDYYNDYDFEGAPAGYAYIDMERWALTVDFADDIWGLPYIKFTGHFEGAEFVPVEAAYEGSKYGSGRWNTFYESADDAAEDCVTIYAHNVQMSFYNEGDPLKYRGKEYANLRELMLTAPANTVPYWEEGTLYGGEYGDREYKLSRILVFGYQPFFHVEEDVDYGSAGAPIMFYMTAAVVCYPLRIAIDELKFVYLFAFAVAALIGVLLRRSVKKNFTDPVKLVYKGVSDGWGYVTTSLDSKTMWREPYEISRHYRETLDKLRADKNEIARLATALEYAEEAEEQRRQMSSNIAHELKTPLAVIRSYAEGLQEHIAEEKRDKYLEVIVGETERMDELVLEMLELSRLEAGRVKLAHDVCDLSALAHSVFEKLEPAAEAKELTITYELQKDCLFSADEARILQVIGNFASNALRYTPVGGHIWVRTSMARGYVSLAVENTSPPLSDEVLGKVWERFWRAEESRSEKSSGLGLAIAKSIVELHGGRCSARNTENGVEFAFTI